jgi:hypothetical protein
LPRNESSAPESGAEENKQWWFYRQKYPELQLTPINGDRLTWLFAGNPDPKLSFEYRVLFEVYWTDYVKHSAAGESHLAEQELLRASELLADFFNRHTFTFRASGWVLETIGVLAITNERAAAHFQKTYWKIANKSSPKADRAYEALTAYSDEHREHLRLAVAHVRKMYNPRNTLEAFKSRILKAYKERKGVRCTCLSNKLLFRICEAVFNFPEEPTNSRLADLAMAKLFETGVSTLAHLRASANTRLAKKVSGERGRVSAG